MVKKLLGRLLKEHLISFLFETDSHLALIPRESCCGKSTVFIGNKRRYICSRCHKSWELIVLVRPIKRTDWDSMIAEVNNLSKRLQKKPRQLKKGYYLKPGSILNAYREGDVTFKKAVAELKKWKSKFKE